MSRGDCRSAGPVGPRAFTGEGRTLVAIEWILAAVVVALVFLVVGFGATVGLRIFTIARATFFVGRIPRADVVALVILVVGIPLGTWSLAFQGQDPAAIALVLLAALGGAGAGRVLAELELRRVPAILAAIAQVQLGSVGWSSPHAGDRALAFVRTTPPYVRAVLESIVLVFNSPWVSRGLGMGFVPFLDKDAGGRRAHLSRWAGDANLRYALEFLKVVLAVGAYDDPGIRAAVRYCGPLVPENSPGGPSVFCPYDPEDAAARGVSGDDRFACWWSS